MNKHQVDYWIALPRSLHTSLKTHLRVQTTDLGPRLPSHPLLNSTRMGPSFNHRGSSVLERRQRHFGQALVDWRISPHLKSTVTREKVVPVVYYRLPTVSCDLMHPCTYLKDVTCDSGLTMIVLLHIVISSKSHR